MKDQSVPVPQVNGHQVDGSLANGRSHRFQIPEDSVERVRPTGNLLHEGMESRVRLILGHVLGADAQENTAAYKQAFAAIVEIIIRGGELSPSTMEALRGGG